MSTRSSTALVTGATAGLRRAVALHLARDGAEVVVHGRDAARGTPLRAMYMWADMPRFARAFGFTLIEVLVVLALMGLAAGLVAPALLHARRQRPALNSLIPTAREEAARRGEMVYLRVDGSGQWRMEGAASPAAGPFAAGHVEPFPGVPLTLIVSPLGTCAFDVPSAAAARVIQLDPLTCDITTP